MDLAAGSMRHMSEAFSEETFRKDFSEKGMPQTEIEDKLAHARANPI